MTELRANAMRNAIVNHVGTEPGVSFTSLLQRIREMPQFAASVGHGALVWHLAQLERARLISSRRWGPFRYYYPRAGPWHADLEACTLVQGEARRSLAALLVSCSGLTIDEIRTRLPETGQRTRQALHLQLRRLRAAGLTLVEGPHKAVRHHATPRLRRAAAALSLRPASADLHGEGVVAPPHTAPETSLLGRGLPLTAMNGS